MITAVSYIQESEFLKPFGSAVDMIPIYLLFILFSF